MIDTIMWRVVIGLWNISRMKHCTNSGFYHYQHKLLEWCLTAICLLLLMMIGGVECNPGPVLRSQKATSETNSLGKRNSCSFHNILYILNKKHCQSYGTDSGIPTYNDMVTMLQGAKKKATKSDAYVGDVLYEMYKTRFPQADIPSRPCRLLEAAERISAPLTKGTVTRNSDYFEKLWIPRIRGQASM